MLGEEKGKINPLRAKFSGAPGGPAARARCGPSSHGPALATREVATPIGQPPLRYREGGGSPRSRCLIGAFTIAGMRSLRSSRRQAPLSAGWSGGPGAGASPDRAGAASRWRSRPRRRRSAPAGTAGRARPLRPPSGRGAVPGLGRGHGDRRGDRPRSPSLPFLCAANVPSPHPASRLRSPRHAGRIPAWSSICAWGSGMQRDGGPRGSRRWSGMPPLGEEAGETD